MNKSDFQKRIGLLGGSFNPAHKGHLYISMQAMEKLKLDEVWWLVNPCNPFKKESDMMPIFERVRIARQIADNQNIKVSAIEEDLGTRFTYDTVAQLKGIYPLAQFVWLMGDDLLPEFPMWKKWKELLDMVDVAVFTRQYQEKDLQEMEAVKYLQSIGKWNYFKITPNPLSSTGIRKSC